MNRNFQAFGAPSRAPGVCPVWLKPLAQGLLSLLLGLGAMGLPAMDNQPLGLEGTAWSVHGDETFIDQGHGHFNSSRPDGPNSFSSRAENSYSTVTGVAIGYQADPDTQWWARIETLRGIPLSNAGGLAALTNNDMQRIMENRFVSYLALGFLSKTWNLDGTSTEQLAPENHQFAQLVARRRFNLLVGKLDVLGIFDDNAYAHKADDQFLNWCFMTHCAYDFAADARGYTWGVSSELDWDDWSGRLGWFAMPILPNQLEIDGSMGQHFGINGELERRWNSGDFKFLVYQGRMRLANFASYANQSGVFIQQAPKTDAKRGGAGVNLQQELMPGMGLFARAFWDGGSSETMAFTEADRSFSTGISLEGALWGRARDGVGVGLIRNEINSARQRFLQNGNYDLFIGDGYLSYAPEAVLETYYRYALGEGVHVTLDWQGIQNPAYNQLRGPVNVVGVRFHAEF